MKQSMMNTSTSASSTALDSRSEPRQRGSNAGTGSHSSSHFRIASSTRSSRGMNFGLHASLTKDSTTSLNFTAYERLAYIVNSSLTKRRSQLVLLTVVGFVSVVIFGVVWAISFTDGSLEWLDRFSEGLWIAWTLMADPGTLVSRDGHGARILNAMNTVLGILFMAALLGMVVDIVREKMKALQQGKTSIVENKHTLILGWSEKALSIIEELTFANESAGGGCVVVLSMMEKEVLTKMVDSQLPPSSRKGTNVVFRNGNPMVASDLMKVAAPIARAIIVLANDGDPDNSDAETIRVVLALKSLKHPLEGHIVAEVRDIDNKQLVNMVGGRTAETLVSHDVLGRLILMAARQPGLAKVYESLLGFQGDEFYMQEWPELVGLQFRDLIERFPDAVPIGICTAMGDVILNPEPERVIEHGEEIIVVAEDDDTYKPEEPADVHVGETPVVAPETPSPEKMLFCGWRRDVRDLLKHLDNIVQFGTEIHIITAFVPLERRRQFLLDEGLDVSTLRRIRLVHYYGLPIVRRKLSALPLQDFSCCMIFADQGFESDTMRTDSHSLATLLLLRDLQAEAQPQKRQAVTTREAHSLLNVGERTFTKELEKVVASSCPVVCEILDPRTQKTINNNAYVSHASEFCQTNKITAQMLAMVAENRAVNTLFNELLGIGGNSLNVYKSSRYAQQCEEISFFTLAKRASRMNETLIGISTKRDKSVILNPPEKHQARVWDEYDMIVLSSSMRPSRDPSAMKPNGRMSPHREAIKQVHTMASKMDRHEQHHFAHIVDYCSNYFISDEERAHLRMIDSDPVRAKSVTVTPVV